MHNGVWPWEENRCVIVSFAVPRMNKELGGAIRVRKYDLDAGADGEGERR